MKQVTEIVWHEYPKEKPKNAGVLLVSFAFEDGITTDILIYSDGKWYNDAAKRYPTGLGGVNAITAFAELPAPYDPTALLNFATALMLMRGGGGDVFSFKRGLHNINFRRFC